MRGINRSLAVAIGFVALVMLSNCGGGSGQPQAALSIVVSSLPDGTVGAPYNQSVLASGGTAPYSWQVSTGSLPPGLKLVAGNGSSATISGTPSAAQNAAAFSIAVTDSTNRKATGSFSINVKNAAGPLISTSQPPPDAVDAVPYAFSFAASGGTGTLSWNETGSLPSGLSFFANGTITGLASESGSFPISVTVTDSAGMQDTRNFTLNAAPSGASLQRLSGHYAFLVQGFRGVNGKAYSAAGSFVADGAGGIQKGHIDANSVGLPQVDVAFTGSYSFDTNDQGTLEITNSKTGPVGKLDIHFRMVTMGPAGAPATAARLVEYDEVVFASGMLQRQDATSFSNSGIADDYIFSLSGNKADDSRIAAAGRFTADGNGTVSNAKLDLNEAGLVTPNADFSMQYDVPANATTGRGTATLNATLSGAPATIHFAVYVVSASEAFLVSSDGVTHSIPLLSGATAQQTGGPFAGSSLNGAFVYAITGSIPSGDAAGLQDTNIGLLTFDGNSAFTLSGDENRASQISTPQISGTYAVSSNGRATITGGAHQPVLYVSGDVGFIVGSDDAASIGTFQKQTADETLKTTLSGSPALFSALPSTNMVWNFTSITALSGGLYLGTWDVGIPFFLPQTMIKFAGSDTIAPNGRGIFNPGNPYQEAFYVVGKNTFVVANSIGTIDQYPVLEIGTCEQVSAAGFGSCP